MLKYREVNLLNVHGLRRLEFCPPHFTPVRFDLRTQEKAITDWIWSHCAGRFYFGDYYQVDPNGKKSMCKQACFEIASEATYMALFLDQINQPTNDLW
jgi:hypothetical protein